MGGGGRGPAGASTRGDGIRFAYLLGSRGVEYVLIGSANGVFGNSAARADVRWRSSHRLYYLRLGGALATPFFRMAAATEVVYDRGFASTSAREQEEATSRARRRRGDQAQDADAGGEALLGMRPTVGPRAQEKSNQHSGVRADCLGLMAEGCARGSKFRGDFFSIATVGVGIVLRGRGRPMLGAGAARLASRFCAI